MTDDHDGHAGFLGEPHQQGGRLPNLADTSGGTFEGIGKGGLDRVENEEVGPNLPRRGQHRLEVGLAEDQNPARILDHPIGPEPDLFGRFLPAGVEHPTAAFDHPSGGLEEQGGFPDARLATDQRHRPGDQPASEHKIEFGNPQRPTVELLAGDIA